MEKHTWLALSQGIALAGFVLLVMITLIMHKHPPLIPIVLFGSLASIFQLVTIGQYLGTLAPLALFMYAFLRYIADRAQYPTNGQMIAAEHAIPSWARTTPNAEQAVEQLDHSLSTRRHSYEYISATGEKPLYVSSLIANRQGTAKNN